ncbi:hypothetical protein TWF106_004465 [Orbilia oligospora]|uniref:Uncharacterized protein n=1 Tax=Orbilia oligospora TaxID=2813651 RepID=A0A7C8QTF6_ORBOL|nr:hypothetical protein TWF106_004465 [Orbilia oligospora]
MRRRKVIFIPDCQSFSGSVFHEVRLSYALAYARDARRFQYLMEMNSWDELINFTDYEHDIGVQHIFIIDGTRAETLSYGNPSAIIADRDGMVVAISRGLLQFRGTDLYNDKEAVALRRDELQVLTGCNFHLLNAALELKEESDTRGLNYDDFLSLLVQREPFRSIRDEVRDIAFSVGFIASNM